MEKWPLDPLWEKCDVLFLGCMIQWRELGVFFVIVVPKDSSGSI